MTLPNQQIEVTRPLLTLGVLENLDLKGRWTNGEGSYEANTPPAQEKFAPRGKNFAASEFVAFSLRSSEALRRLREQRFERC